ncbi:MAG: hypothetical protein LBQ77_01430 [Treponema sp.]|nr:hypothetical protein [Treponema sp.]
MSDDMSVREARNTARENRRTVSLLEKAFKKSDSPKQRSSLKDPNNIVECDNLKIYFFTEISTVAHLTHTMSCFCVSV